MWIELPCWLTGGVPIDQWVGKKRDGEIPACVGKMEGMGELTAWGRDITSVEGQREGKDSHEPDGYL